MGSLERTFVIANTKYVWNGIYLSEKRTSNDGTKKNKKEFFGRKMPFTIEKSIFSIFFFLFPCLGVGVFPLIELRLRFTLMMTWIILARVQSKSNKINSECWIESSRRNIRNFILQLIRFSSSSWLLDLYSTATRSR